MAILLSCSAACSAESGDDADSSGEPLELPERYVFGSRFAGCASSVNYAEQTYRHVLLAALEAELQAVQSELEGGATFRDDEVGERLRFYYHHAALSTFVPETLEHGFVTTPPALQTTWADISERTDFGGSIAGNGSGPAHEEWATGLIGWEPSVSPHTLALTWIDAIDDLAVRYSQGDVSVDLSGAPIGIFYVSAEGLNYRELLHRLLLGAGHYWHATHVHLDVGLDSDNVEAVDDQCYTELAHAWDQAFGDWGGAREYLAFGDEAIVSEGYRDLDGDDAIDLTSEVNFGASVDAAARDLGAAQGAPTDYTAETMVAFLNGRYLIAGSSETPSDGVMQHILLQRDQAVEGWDRTLAATAVHYFNATLRDMDAAQLKFSDFAKDWSSLKGYLLMLQFNPRSHLSKDALRSIHALVGLAPVFPGDVNANGYREDLLGARTMLAEAYAFDAANVGDDAGQGGW